MTVPPPVRHRFSGHPGQFRILPWKVCKVYTLSGFWSVGLPIGLALPRRPARFVSIYMPVAADAARAGVRVRALLQPGHMGLCTNAFFSHKSLTQKRLIYQRFFAHPLLFLQLRKMQNSLPPPRFRFLTRLTMSTSVVGHI